MAEVRKVDADLMFASGARDDAQKGKAHLTPALSPHLMGGEGKLFAACLRKKPVESSFDPIFRLRCRAVEADTVFDGDNTPFVLAERRVNQAVFVADVTVDDGKVF